MPRPRTWDIFCRVIDNYGDIGVCWRLARQLVASQNGRVRLWLDNLDSLRPLVIGLDRHQLRQTLDGIAIHHWTETWRDVEPAEVCIEGFGCGLPEHYAAALAARRPRALWVVLEYLSAEPWVREHHGLPSPHPRLTVDRWFFFPGFERGTGGLLREQGLLHARERHTRTACERYWRELGFAAPPPTTPVISVFGYERAPLAPLLDHWARGRGAIVVALPVGPLATKAVQHLSGSNTEPGASCTRGSVEVRVLPFVPQQRYDESLWSADCLFVRGEDSIVRAQWAAKPFIWQIYAQAERAHERKLDAFLDLYCAGLAREAATSVRKLSAYWNDEAADAAQAGMIWEHYWAHRQTLAIHGQKWADLLLQTGELAENLAEFCADKLK